MSAKHWIGLVVVGCSVVFCGSGCEEGDRLPAIRYDFANPYEPLVFRVDAKSRVRLGDRWVDIYWDQPRVVAYLRACAQAYQQWHPLSEGPTRRTIPVPVVIEFETGTRGGTVFCLRRLLREQGFDQITIRRAGAVLTVS
ncbi:MAG: hypothetical protein C4297_09055 [Gemmataceae bacterium]